MSKPAKDKGPTDAELRKQTEEADKKAEEAKAKEVEEAKAKAKVSAESAKIKAAMEKKAAEKSRREEAEAKEAERVAGLPKVAEGKSVTSRRGVLDEGTVIEPCFFREDLKEDAEVVADLVKRGFIIEGK